MSRRDANGWVLAMVPTRIIHEGPLRVIEASGWLSFIRVDDGEESDKKNDAPTINGCADHVNWATSNSPSYQ